MDPQDEDEILTQPQEPPFTCVTPQKPDADGWIDNSLRKPNPKPEVVDLTFDAEASPVPKPKEIPLVLQHPERYLSAFAFASSSSSSSFKKKPSPLCKKRIDFHNAEDWITIKRTTPSQPKKRRVPISFTFSKKLFP